MTWRTFFAFVAVIGLTIGGGNIQAGHVLTGLGLISINTILLGAIVANLERAAEYTLGNVLVEGGITVSDLDRVDRHRAIYLLTNEGRIRPVKSLFTAYFHSEEVVVLEEKYVQEN